MENFYQARNLDIWDTLRKIEIFKNHERWDLGNSYISFFAFVSLWIKGSKMLISFEYFSLEFWEKLGKWIYLRIVKLAFVVPRSFEPICLNSGMQEWSHKLFKICAKGRLQKLLRIELEMMDKFGTRCSF